MRVEGAAQRQRGDTEVRRDAGQRFSRTDTLLSFPYLLLAQLWGSSDVTTALLRRAHAASCALAPMHAPNIGKGGGNAKEQASRGSGGVERVAERS
jgi:hypothetical protein